MKYEPNLSVERKNIAKKIDKFLMIDDFRFDIDYLMAIHKYLFNGVLPNAGNFRDCNLARRETILNGKSLVYADYKKIPLYLRYDFDEEGKKKYNNMTSDDFIKNIANFTLKLWLTHPFRDGNTRTVSVFIQKYLMSLGCEINRDIFEDSGKYFRNALVLAGYYDYDLGIYRNMEYLILFFKKLLIDKNIELNIQEVYVPKLFDVDSKQKVLKK